MNFQHQYEQWQDGEALRETLQLCLTQMRRHGNMTNWDCGIDSQYTHALSMGQAILNQDHGAYLVARGNLEDITHE